MIPPITTLSPKMLAIDQTGFGSFPFDVGPTLTVSFLVSALMLFLWYQLCFIPMQLRYKRKWLNQNKGLVRRYMILAYLLKTLAKNISNCNKCGEEKMQLWDYAKGILIYRCCRCKMSYGITQHQSKIAQLVIGQLGCIPGLTTTILANRHEALGKHLMQELPLDIELTKNESNPFAFYYFKAEKSIIIEREMESIMNIDVIEWQVVLFKEEYKKSA